MGRLTEYFQYLETPPDKLMDFKFRSAWITKFKKESLLTSVVG